MLVNKPMVNMKRKKEKRRNKKYTEEAFQRLDRIKYVNHEHCLQLQIFDFDSLNERAEERFRGLSI